MHRQPSNRAIKTKLKTQSSMQSKENKSIDARPFTAIWPNLTKGEQAYFKDKIRHETGISLAAIYKWINGQSTPMFAHMKIIVSTLTQMGYRTTTRTLFPA